MTKPNLLFSLLFILFSITLYANDKSDSLLSVAKDIERSTNDRLSAYSDLVYHFEVSDPERAIELGEEGLQLPLVDSLKNDLAYLYVNMGFVYNTAQEYEDAIPYFQKAADYYLETGNIKNAALQIKNIGVIHRKLGNYSKSIKFQLNSIEKYESINDTSGQVDCLMNIGNIYVFQKQAELSLPYFKKAYDLANLFKNPLLVAQATNSLALGYEHFNKNDTALYYYLIAIDDYSNLKKWVRKAKAEHNVALIYMGKENYSKAEEMLLSSLSVFKQAPSSMAIEKATIQLALARVYNKTNRQELAVYNYKKALEVFREKGAKTEEKSTLGYLSKSLEKQEEFKESLYYLNKFIILKDSIQNINITTEIAELNEKYESEKKEKEILSLQHENELEARSKWVIVSISIALITTIIIIFLLYYQRQIKEKERVKIRLKQNSRELDILHQKIERGTTQYSTRQEFTLCREDVNHLLKDALSERELDVFMLLIKGYTNKAIGEELFVSVNTIKFHLQNIYVKLDVDNRTDAISTINKKKMTEDVLEVSS